MATFNLTAQLNLKGPTNVKQIASQIKKDLGSLNANVQFKLDPAATKNVAALSASLKTLNANFAATVKSAGAATSAIKSFGNSINSIKINSVPQQINQTSTAISKLNKVSAGSARGLQSASTEMQEFGKQAGLAVRRFVAFSTVTSVIYGVTNAINNGVQAFIDYDRELVKLQQVTGESAAGLSKLQSQITNLATEFGVSSKELTQVASTLAQAGLSARETEKALKALALSSLAPSFDNMNETVEGSIALMRQFGISADQLEGSLGAVNTVAAKFAVESSDIITAIQRTGSVFATASKGVSEGKDALNEFIAVFTSIRATSRESAETIATGLRTIFTRIQRGTTIDALKEFGVNLTDTEGKFVGAYKAVELLSKGLSKIDPRSLDFSRIVEELGGFRQIGKVIPLIQQFGVAQQALKVAQQGQGSLAKDAATAQLSLANQIAKVREEFFALFREIGQSKGFQSLIRGTLSLTSGLIKVADAVKGILPALAVIAAFKGFKALTEFTTGFATGVKRGPDGKAGGGIIRKFARGGVVPGSGNGDTVPAMLEPGEFVIRKKAVQAIGTDKLHNMNRYAKGGKIKKYFKGGIARSSIGSLANESPSVKSYLGNGIDTTDDATTNIISVPIDLDDSDFRQMRDIMVSTERQRLDYIKKYSNESNDKLVRSRAKGPRDARSVKGFLGMKKPLSQWGAGNAFQQLLIKKYGLKAPASNLGSPDETFQDIIDEHYAVLDYESGDAKFVKNPDYFDSPRGQKEVLNKRFKYEYSNNRLKPKPSPKYDDFQLPSTSIYYAKDGLKEKFLKEYPWTVAQQAKAEFPGGAYNFGGKIKKFMDGGLVEQGVSKYLESDVIKAMSEVKGVQLSKEEAIKEFLRRNEDGDWYYTNWGIPGKTQKPPKWLAPYKPQSYDALDIVQGAIMAKQDRIAAWKKRKGLGSSEYEGRSQQEKSFLKSRGRYADGGLVQQFMAGSAVEKLPTSASNIIKALGGALPASNAAGVGVYEVQDLLKKQNLSPKQQEARKKLLKAYGDLGIEQANAEESAIKKATKFNIVGLFGSTKVGTDANGKEIFEPKWDYSYNMGPQDIGGRSTYIMARGLKSQYASIVYDMQKEQQALDAKFAKNLQMQSIFGSQGPLVFDFDETLVASDPTPMLNAAKTGIDYAKFDNLQLVRDSLKTARLTDLGEELKSRLSDTPELLNEIRVLTARPQSNARPLAETLQRLGLNIPESKITGVSGPENKFANLSELETLIDDRVETIKSIRKKGRKGVAYGELISSDSNPAIKAGTAQVEGAIIEKALAALGAPLIENADPQRPIDYPQGIGAQAAQFFGVDDPSLPTEVKRTLDGNAFERARKEIARFYNENTQEFAVGGPVKEVWHGTTTGAGNKVLESFKKNGALSSVATGFGQGSGFYVYTDPMTAMMRALNVTGGAGFTTNADPEGSPMVLKFMEQLNSKDWDLDYEMQNSDIVDFIYHNYEKVKAALEKSKGIELPNNLKDFALMQKYDEYLDTSDNTMMRKVGISFKENDKTIERTLANNRLGDIRSATVLSSMVQSVLKSDPDLYNEFEQSFFDKLQPEQAIKYVGSQPLKPVLAKILDNKKLEWETQKLAKGGKVSEEYSKILASILPSSMLTSDNMLKMPSGEAEPIEFVAPDLKKQSRNKMMAILLGKKEEKESGSSFYKGGLSFKALRYRLEQSKDKLQKPEYDALKTFIDQNLLFEGNDDIISIMNSRHKGVLPHETFHDIQGHLYDNYPEIMDKLLAGVESQKEAITQWYNDPKNKEWAGPKNYRLEHFFPTADTKNAYSADIITAAHASVKKKTKQDPSMELYSVLGKGLQDLGRNEAIPVLLSAAAVNNKGATEILSKIFGGAGLNPDFYKTLPKYATGGSVEDTVPALLTPGEFVINKKAAQQIGYGQLEKLNKADKIKGFNKGGSVGVFQRFASGGGVDDPLLMLQRFTKYLASNGQMSNRPSQINTNTIAVDSSIIDETKAFVQSLYDAGDAMKYLTQLLEQNKQLSIKATLEAGEKDLERLKISGASIDKIVAAERALSSIREKGMQDVAKRQFLEAGFQESTVGKKLGSGATQQKILSLAEKEERRLLDKRRQSIESDIIASSKTPISKSDLADQVNQILSSELEDIKSKAFSRATSAATGTSTSTGIKGSITATELKNLNISGSDIQKYISDSMRDRKTLRQMDQQLIALRMEEYKNAGTVRGISVASAEEAKKLATEEVRKRREAINDLAKMRGEKGVGAADFMDVRNSPIAKAFRERYFTGDLGKSMQRGLGDIGMVSGLVAGQGRNIGSALFDDNTDQGKIKAAKEGARVEKAATTLSIGLTTSAQLATINPMLGAAAAIGTALYAGADAVLDFSGTSKQAAQEMEKSLLNDKLQTAADILSESFRKLNTDVNNVNLRSKAASNIAAYQDLALKSTRLETQQQQTQTETRNWTQWAQGGGPFQSLSDLFGGSNSWIARNTGIGTMGTDVNKGAYGVDKIRAEAIKEVDTYRAVSNEAYQDLSRLYSAGFSNAQIMDPSDARGKIVRSSIESMALSDVDRLTSYKTALATDPTGASAKKLLDQFTKDFLDKDELAKASQEAAKLARAMELADKAGRRLAASFDKISDVINESINRISFESDARMESANQAISALRGESTVSGPKLRERNILENPNAYSEAEFTKALETATQGLDAGTRKQLIGGAQLQQNIPKNIAQSIAGVLNNSRSAGVDEAKKAAIDTAQSQIENNANLSREQKDQLKSIASARIENIAKKAKENNADSGMQLSEFMKELEDGTNILGDFGKKLLDSVKALSSFKEVALDKFAKGLNEASKAAKEAQIAFRKAREITNEGNMNLREVLKGYGETYDEKRNRIMGEVSGLAGGETTVQGIKNRQIQLAGQRETLQKQQDTLTDPDALRKNVEQLNKLDNQLRDNKEALDMLANSTELVDKAFSDLQNTAELQNNRQNFVNQLLTNTPEEADKLNQSFIRLQRNLSGGLNSPYNQRDARKAFNEALFKTGNVREATRAGNTVLANQRKETLALMQDPGFRAAQELQIRNQYAMGQGKPGVSADQAIAEYFKNQQLQVTKQMAVESGMINNPLVQQSLAALDNREADPAMKQAAERYLEAVGLRSDATKAQGELSLLESQSALKNANDNLRISIDDLRATIEGNMNEAGMGTDAAGNRIVNPGVVVGAPPVARSSGGLIYASNGKLIDFKPKGTDTVPAMLSPGEFVINAKSTQKHLPLLESINSGYFDKGGLVSSFTQFDKDKNRLLDRKEFTKYFSDFDLNKDNSIDMKEFRSGMSKQNSRRKSLWFKGSKSRTEEEEIEYQNLRSLLNETKSGGIGTRKEMLDRAKGQIRYQRQQAYLSRFRPDIRKSLESSLLNRGALLFPDGSSPKGKFFSIEGNRSTQNMADLILPKGYTGKLVPNIIDLNRSDSEIQIPGLQSTGTQKFAQVLLKKPGELAEEDVKILEQIAFDRTNRSSLKALSLLAASGRSVQPRYKRPIENFETLDPVQQSTQLAENYNLLLDDFRRSRRLVGPDSSGMMSSVSSIRYTQSQAENQFIDKAISDYSKELFANIPENANPQLLKHVEDVKGLIQQRKDLSETGQSKFDAETNLELTRKILSKQAAEQQTSAVLMGRAEADDPSAGIGISVRPGEVEASKIRENAETQRKIDERNQRAKDYEAKKVALKLREKTIREYFGNDPEGKKRADKVIADLPLWDKTTAGRSADYNTKFDADIIQMGLYRGKSLTNWNRSDLISPDEAVYRYEAQVKRREDYMKGRAAGDFDKFDPSESPTVQGIMGWLTGKDKGQPTKIKGVRVMSEPIKPDVQSIGVAPTAQSIKIDPVTFRPLNYSESDIAKLNSEVKDLETQLGFKSKDEYTKKLLEKKKGTLSAIQQAATQAMEVRVALNSQTESRYQELKKQADGGKIPSSLEKEYIKLSLQRGVPYGQIRAFAGNISSVEDDMRRGVFSDAEMKQWSRQQRKEFEVGLAKEKETSFYDKVASELSDIARKNVDDSVTSLTGNKQLGQAVGLTAGFGTGVLTGIGNPSTTAVGVSTAGMGYLSSVGLQAAAGTTAAGLQYGAGQNEAAVQTLKDTATMAAINLGLRILTDPRSAKLLEQAKKEFAEGISNPPSLTEFLNDPEMREIGKAIGYTDLLETMRTGQVVETTSMFPNATDAVKKVGEAIERMPTAGAIRGTEFGTGGGNAATLNARAAGSAVSQGSTYTTSQPRTMTYSTAGSTPSSMSLTDIIPPEKLAAGVVDAPRIVPLSAAEEKAIAQNIQKLVQETPTSVSGNLKYRGVRGVYKPTGPKNVTGNIQLADASDAFALSHEQYHAASRALGVLENEGLLNQNILDNLPKEYSAVAEGAGLRVKTLDDYTAARALAQQTGKAIPKEIALNAQLARVEEEAAVSAALGEKPTDNPSYNKELKKYNKSVKNKPEAKPPTLKSQTSPKPAQKKANGGLIYAQQGDLIDFAPRGTDTVPAMLTPGEFVVNAQSTKQNLPLLHAINKNKGGKINYLEKGGQPHPYQLRGQRSIIPKSVEPIKPLTASEMDMFEKSKPASTTTDFLASQMENAKGEAEANAIMSTMDLRTVNERLGADAAAFGLGAAEGGAQLGAASIATYGTAALMGLTPAAPLAPIVAPIVGGVVGALTKYGIDKTYEATGIKDTTDAIKAASPGANFAGNMLPAAGLIASQGAAAFAGTMSDRIAAGSVNAISDVAAKGLIGEDITLKDAAISFGTGAAIGSKGAADDLAGAFQAGRRGVGQVIGGEYGRSLQLTEADAARAAANIEAQFADLGDKTAIYTGTAGDWHLQPGAKTRASGNLGMTEFIPDTSNESVKQFAQYTADLDPTRGGAAGHGGKAGYFDTKPELPIDYARKGFIQGKGAPSVLVAEMPSTMVQNAPNMFDPNAPLTQSMQNELLAGQSPTIYGNIPGRSAPSDIATPADVVNTYVQKNLGPDVAFSDESARAAQKAIVEQTLMAALPDVRSISHGQIDPALAGIPGTALAVNPEVLGQHTSTDLFEASKIQQSSPDFKSAALSEIGIDDNKEKPKKYNFGGIVYANNGALTKASGQIDSIPAMLTPGEFVINKDSAKKHLPVLQAINSGYFSRGGIVNYLASGGIATPHYYASGGSLSRFGDARAKKIQEDNWLRQQMASLPVASVAQASVPLGQEPAPRPVSNAAVPLEPAALAPVASATQAVKQSASSAGGVSNSIGIDTSSISSSIQDAVTNAIGQFNEYTEQIGANFTEQFNSAQKSLSSSINTFQTATAQFGEHASAIPTSLSANVTQTTSLHHIGLDSIKGNMERTIYENTSTNAKNISQDTFMQYDKAVWEGGMNSASKQGIIGRKK